LQQLLNPYVTIRIKYLIYEIDWSFFYVTKFALSKLSFG